MSRSKSAFNFAWGIVLIGFWGLLETEILVSDYEPPIAALVVLFVYLWTFALLSANGKWGKYSGKVNLGLLTCFLIWCAVLSGYYGRSGPLFPSFR